MQRVIASYSKAYPRRDIVVVLHWGFEFSMYPMPYDVNLARRLSLIENVRLIIGHHPHNPQPFEVHNGVTIYYSLGNFYFSGKRKGFKRSFPGEIEDLCDYGLGVIVDTKSWSSDEVLIKVDRSRLESRICDLQKPLFCMPNAPVESKEYRLLAKRCSLKRSPVLTSSRVQNFCKLSVFNLKRNLYPKFIGVLNIIGRR